MKSPFPGMDPYLERHWLDVHGSLIFLAKTALQPQLGDELVARSEERLIVEDATGQSRMIGPDVRVVEHGLRGPVAPAASGIALAEPIVLKVEAEPIRQRNIEIIDVAGGRVVTIIEFVSPSNKLPGDGRDKYRKKQDECRLGDVNLVEIDLTRSGRRELLAHRWIGARHHDSTYQVSVWRASRSTQAELYPVHLKEQLPLIRIPLRAHDPDVVLNVQALVDAAYEASRFDRTIDYRQPCTPPLEGEEATWADEVLKAAGKAVAPRTPIVSSTQRNDHIRSLGDGTFALALWPCRADVLRLVFSPRVPIVWLRHHMPSESLEWWRARVPLVRGEDSKSIRIRGLTFDLEMPTSDFFEHISELNEHRIEAYQLSRGVPNTLTLDGLEWGSDKRRHVLIQNGCVAGFYLPHVGEVAQFWTSDRAMIESALAHEPVVQAALRQA